MASTWRIHHDASRSTFSLLPVVTTPDAIHDGAVSVSVLADSEGGGERLKRGRKKRKREEGDEEGGDENTAYLSYKIRKSKGVKVMDMMHTYVPEALRGKGLGNMLVDGKTDV